MVNIGCSFIPSLTDSVPVTSSVKIVFHCLTLIEFISLFCQTWSICSWVL